MVTRALSSQIPLIERSSRLRRFAPDGALPGRARYILNVECVWRAATMPDGRRFGAGALLGLLFLTGCAESTMIYNQRVNNRYSPTEFGVAAGRKDLRTVVHGDPFGMGPEAFSAATLATLNRHPPPPQPTTFTTEPGESANPAYRLVLVFDAPRLPNFQVCREPLPASAQQPPGEEGGTLYVVAGFCLNQAELTAVNGRLNDVEGVDDPRFDRLLGQVVMALFPPFDPNDRRNRKLLLIADAH
jgi:hypothetical protein